MDSHIKHKEARYVLELLQRIDDGEALTEAKLRDLGKIRSADFSNFELTKLPDSIDRLSGLTELNVSDNQLTSLPESIGALTSLMELSASRNQLTSLPESITKLCQLSALYVFNNQLTALSENIGRLSQLRILFVSSNQLASLPEGIGELSQLTYLYVSHNELTSLPESIRKLSCLKKLDASDNLLPHLPGGIGGLSQLAELDVSRNQLSSLPEGIGMLSQLTELKISNNRLSSLPENIGELSQLMELSVYSNPLTSLPDGIGKLVKLTDLQLGRTGLQEVPSWIQGLTELEKLDLAANPLKTLPDWLGDMPKLYRLQLSYLRLTEFPRSLLKLNLPFLADFEVWCDKSHLRGIYIENTELSIQPVSLFDQSRDASPDFRRSRKLIEDYFETKKIPVREAKVIFLGDGKVGKTYTIQRLLHDCRKGDYPTKETHGILIEDLYPEKDGKTYRVRIWDFGGQDIMHEMHRCFLTDRTCYVVMVDTRTDKQTGRARYWLRTVQSIAPEAPVLLLVNEISGGQNRDLDYSGLKREFPNLVGVEYCSAMDAGDEEFRQKVEEAVFQQALDLDSCKMELPESWEMVRQNLLSLQGSSGAGQEKVYYIDRQMFHSLCDQYAVPADDGLRAWLLTWFNDLGVCFSYHLGEDGQEQSTDYKILDPMWLTSAVYKIIWEKDRTDDGLISLSEIYQILKQPGSTAMKKGGIPCLENVTYNKKECSYVLDIMRMFCISYPADKSMEFMPTLCKPDSKMDPVPQHWTQHAAYRFRYTFLPENVLHRLMIYCFANLRPGKRWRRGFWLECEAQGLSAVIRATGRDSEENELQVDVYAQKEQYEAWTWLQPLCQQIMEINSALSLKAEVLILAENDREKKWFPLDSLLYWKNQGARSMQGERTSFSIQDLIELIYGKHYPDVERKVLMNREQLRLEIPWETYLQIVTVQVAERTGLDLSKPFPEALGTLTEELKRGHDLLEKEIDLQKQGIDALRGSIDATGKNTLAVEGNTLAVEENTLTLQQSNDLLQAIRSGKVMLPKEVMAALAKELRQSEEPELQAAGQSMRWKFWKGKMQLLRDLLGDAANLAAIAPILVKLGKTYGPMLMELTKIVVAV